MGAGFSTIGCRSRGKLAAIPDDAALEVFRPTVALSLRAVAAAFREGGGGAVRVAHLGGLNRLMGVSAENNGDVWFLGHREPSRPAHHIDDLAIALRSAFQAGPRYQEPIGCSIDPREGADDPWRIQAASIFGMEPSEMAARHVAIDYELKKASLGLTVLKPGMPSLMDGAGRISDCAAAAALPNGATETVHRFWFCPKVPDAPRFVRDAETIRIAKPVGAQVLTEEEFLDSKAHRVGARRAEGAAIRFAQAVSELLVSGELPQYAALRGDFRLIEAAKLAPLLGVRPSAVGYYLTGHAVREAKVPQFVGGLWREESSEFTCSNQVEETAIPGGTSYQSSADVRRRRQRVTGGVEARVPITERDVRAGNNELSAMMRRVREARPSADAAIWTVPV
jgi:hypothetical protein